MPIYDYSCSRCGHLTEVIHGINDDGPRFCPACGAEGTMRKGFSTPAVHFKGSGWARKERTPASARTAGKDAVAKDAGSGDGGGTGASKAAAADGAATATSDAVTPGRAG